MDAISEIKSKLSIEELVWEYVNLKKAWKNYKWLCPWHQEKTASFIINPDKQICWCFACQKWWDVFNFLEYTENLEFKEIIQILANRVWVQLSNENFSSKGKKDSLVGILWEISNFYSTELSKNEKALSYLQDRGITKSEIEIFSIWYSPKNWNLLYSHLLDLWFKKEDILATWVLIENEISHSSIYDRFHSRIVFPICLSIWRWKLANVVWFWGRIFNWENNIAKYINSPDSDIYDKSSVLFRIDLAKNEIKKEDYVLIVEWYLDVISCFKFWIKNCVASSWTAFTENQIKLLKRYTSNFYFCFDWDKAWFDAAMRVISTCSQLDINIKFISIPNWKDPDESLNKDSEKFKDILKKPLSIIDFLILHFSKEDIKSVEWKKKVEKEIFAIIINVYNNLEKQEYLKKLSEFLDITENNVILDFENFKKSIKKSNNTVNWNWFKNLKLSHEDYLVWLYLSYPNLAHLIKEKLIISISSNENLKKVYKSIYNNYNVEDFLKNLDKDNEEKILSLSLYAQNINEKSNESKVISEINKTIKNINLKNILTKETELLKLLKKANEQDLLILTNKYQEIIKLKNKLLIW